MMKNTAKKYLTLLESLLSHTIETVIIVFFITIFLVVFTLVLLRYGFSKSLFGGAEFVTVLFIYSSAFGSAILFRERKHIRVSYFLKKMPLTLRKVVVVFSYLLNIVFHIALFYFAFDWIAATGSFRTAILQVPHWVMQISIPIYSSIVVVYLLRNIILVLTKNEYVTYESMDEYITYESIDENVDESKDESKGV